MGKHGKKTEIVKAIIALAKSLGVLTIAEGVETQEQLDQIRELECEFCQGYLFSRPVEAKAARDILITHVTQKTKKVSGTAIPSKIAAKP
jgi:EAL domain-containing protein (putative c-di-GMP-specific phosphodiesterase class I)